MEYILDLITLGLLSRLVWVSSHPAPAPDLKSLVKDALIARVKEGSGRERLKLRLAEKLARRSAAKDAA